MAVNTTRGSPDNCATFRALGYKIFKADDGKVSNDKQQGWSYILAFPDRHTHTSDNLLYITASNATT